MALKLPKVKNYNKLLLNDLENKDVKIPQAENYEEDLIDQIYESKTKRITIQGPNSKALFSNSNVHDKDFTKDQGELVLLGLLLTHPSKLALAVQNNDTFKRDDEVTTVKAFIAKESPDYVSDTESINDNQEPLAHLPKLSEAELTRTSKGMSKVPDLSKISIVYDKTIQISENGFLSKPNKKKTLPKSSSFHEMKLMKKAEPTTKELMLEMFGGVGEDHKRSWVRRLCYDNKIHFLGLQETMSSLDSRLIVQAMWGHLLFDFWVKKPDGKSGGIMAIWDPSKFAMSNSTTGDGFLAVLDSANSNSVIMGDFNEVRYATERMGSHFCRRSASFFNDFISSSGLLDIPMGGMRFTRMNTLGSKLSKIDRILVSNHFLDKWLNSHILALIKEFSYHSSLLLLNSVNDFGPIPFKFYNSWLLHEDFVNVITNRWSSPTDSHLNLSAAIFKAKLKKLKLAIKLWRTTVVATETTAAMELREKKMEIDVRAEHSLLSAADMFTRSDIVKSLTAMEHKNLKDQRQKAKVLLGTDIVNYVNDFHGLPHIPRGCNSSFITLVPKVDDPITIGDFRPISLIGCQHKIIAKVLANRLATVIPSVIGEVQMAFLKGHQITDGPLLVKEIVSWAWKRKKKLLIFKVDFEKAFDSLSWSFLDSIMDQMGFGAKWKTWIQVCLNSAYTSILINESPTKEFKIEKGLRKWWRFLNEENAFWRKIIISIHGDQGGLSTGSFLPYKMGPWYQIVKLKNDLLSYGITLPSLFKRKIGNGLTTKFWLDSWIGGPPICNSFSRLFRLERNTNCHVYDRVPQPAANRPLSTASIPGGSHRLNPSASRPQLIHNCPLPMGLSFTWDWIRPLRSAAKHQELQELCSLISNLCLSNDEDMWECIISDDKRFTVKSMRTYINNLLHPLEPQPFKWNKILPIKINISSWQIFHKRLPTHCNLNRRGIDLNSTRCPVCDEDIETKEHLFNSCRIAKDTWFKVLIWWKINNVSISSLSDAINLAERVNIPGSLKCRKGKVKAKFGLCQHCGFKNHLSEECYNNHQCLIFKSTDHLTEEHKEQVIMKKTPTQLKSQTPRTSTSGKAPAILNP
ncbi:RNA-directed DNA polymerase, eukaryota, reverse transcriptase zinc-binding domain protein [Tanacetum coccineum]